MRAAADAAMASVQGSRFKIRKKVLQGSRFKIRKRVLGMV
jgi:hypothetical protein